MKLFAKLPHDDEGAKLMRFEDIRGQRYTEIFLIGGHAITHHLVGGVYNTIGMNDPAGTGDTCPQAVLDKVDVDELLAYIDLQQVNLGAELACIASVITITGDHPFWGGAGVVRRTARCGNVVGAEAAVRQQVTAFVRTRRGYGHARHLPSPA